MEPGNCLLALPWPVIVNLNMKYLNLALKTRRQNMEESSKGVTPLVAESLGFDDNSLIGEESFFFRIRLAIFIIFSFCPIHENP